MSAPSPTATGSLGKTPLANLLVYLLDHRLTGTLVVEEAGVRSAVTLAQGVPVKVRLASPEHLLGDLLVEAGAITAAARDRGVTVARQENALTGFVLVREGAASAEDVQEALTRQVLRRLDLLARLPPSAVYGYYDGHDFLRSYGGPRGAEGLDPLAAIWHVVRRHAPEAQVQGILGRLGSRPLKLSRGARPARFGFDAAESAVIDVLRVKPYDLESLVGTGLLAASQIQRIVLVLALTRHLDLGADAAPLGVDVDVAVSQGAASVAPILPEGPNRAPTAERPADGARERALDADRAVDSAEEGPIPLAPGTGAAGVGPAPAAREAATLTPEHEALRGELLRRAEQMGGLNYYAILGVDPTADEGSIRAAFFQLAKQWHPDRLPSALAEHRAVAAKVFARMTEAHQVLSSEEQRRDYDQLMKEGGATPDEQARVQQVLRAAMAFQKAEVLARKGSWMEAEREAKLAFESDPDQAEYGALYADVLTRQPGRTQFEDALKLVNNAKKLQPDNLRVRLYRARVLQRAGQHKAAIAEFQHVAEADPRNVEAAREVRLFHMRKGQKKSAEQEAGKDRKGAPGGEGILNQDIGQLFGKLFKR
jgi:curved DNA-binding protein CbpA